MWNFKEDLEKWRVMEDRVMDALKDDFNIIKNPNERWMDLLIISEWIEVKLDEYSKYSGNFFLEFECNGKPSWIYKEEDVHLRYWAHSDWERVYVINWVFLKDWVAQKIYDCQCNKSLTSKWCRLIEAWWNGWRSKWLLVPTKDFEALAEKIYILT